MILIALLVLAYGPPNWSLPWWIWMLAVLHTLGEGAVETKRNNPHR